MMILGLPCDHQSLRLRRDTEVQHLGPQLRSRSTIRYDSLLVATLIRVGVIGANWPYHPCDSHPVAPS